LELAQDLVKLAENDSTLPIPVVFKLSSWTLQRTSLADWLIDELNQLYDAPREIAGKWVKNHQILPLLDGHGEVAQDHCEACVAAINAFREEHGLLPLVVCSRSADYEVLSGRLRLPGAVTIQPLTRAQAAQYLERARTALSGIGAALREDETLWELLNTPLMLSIFTLAYQGQTSSGVRIARLKGSLNERRSALFDAYI
jgi:predicted NACHT family NTPase